MKSTVVLTWSLSCHTYCINDNTKEIDVLLLVQPQLEVEKMSKKIAFIHGSPRKNSNTHGIAQIAIRATQQKKSDVTEIDSIKLEHKIPGCVSCMKCHQSEEFACKVDDQLAKTVATLPEYDVIIIATPAYWMSFPAQLKMLIDRMGSLMKFTPTGEPQTPLAGKTLGIIATGGGVLENNLNLLEQQWRQVASMFSCQFVSCLVPNVPIDTGSLVNDDIAQAKAQDFGRLLASK